MTKQIPEKCRLCSKLTAVQAQHLHGPQGNDCWDSAVCPSRRSHARHRDRRNQARNLKRQLDKQKTTIVLSDSVAAPAQTVSDAAPSVSQQLQFVTELPIVVHTAVLQVYRSAVDAPLHAVGGEIWLGTEKQADITPVHCMKLTPRQVEIYLERLLKKLSEIYGIRKFASIEELHPDNCPLLGCTGR